MTDSIAPDLDIGQFIGKHYCNVLGIDQIEDSCNRNAPPAMIKFVLSYIEIFIAGFCQRSRNFPEEIENHETIDLKIQTYLIDTHATHCHWIYCSYQFFLQKRLKLPLIL